MSSGSATKQCHFQDLEFRWAKFNKFQNVKQLIMVGKFLDAPQRQTGSKSRAEDQNSGKNPPSNPSERAYCSVMMR